jgi:hypothetical protein
MVIADRWAVQNLLQINMADTIRTGLIAAGTSEL